MNNKTYLKFELFWPHLNTLVIHLISLYDGDDGVNFYNSIHFSEKTINHLSFSLDTILKKKDASADVAPNHAKPITSLSSRQLGAMKLMKLGPGHCDLCDAWVHPWVYLIPCLHIFPIERLTENGRRTIFCNPEQLMTKLVETCCVDWSVFFADLFGCSHCIYLRDYWDSFHDSNYIWNVWLVATDEHWFS